MEENKWIETTDRFVAFFDIMGFKDMVARNAHEEVLEKMMIISRVKDSIQAHNNKIIKSVLFSDSFLLISNRNTDNDADQMMRNAVAFVGYCLSNNIPVKGCITHGKMTADFNKSIFFGQPLIDAFLLQEELQIYGCVLHHSFDKAIININKELRFYSYRNKIPLKTGRVMHGIINWTHVFDSKQKALSYVEKLYHTVSGKPRIYISNTIETIDYLCIDEFKKLLKNHDKTSSSSTTTP